MSQLCPVDGCNKVLKARGLTQHLRRMHPNFDLKLEDFEHPTPPPRAGSPDLESRDVNLPPQSPLDRQRISAREQLPNLAQMYVAYYFVTMRHMLTRFKAFSLSVAECTKRTRR